jgi:hypothetical protein
MRLFYLGLSLSLAVNGWAGLIGTSVTGTLNFGGGGSNYYDPANGLVPAGYLNTSGPTVTIAEPAIEFGFADSVNRDVTNFTDSILTFTDTCVTTTCTANNSIDLYFTNNAFTSIALLSSDFTISSWGLAGNTIHITIPAFSMSQTTYTAQFLVGSEAAGVPEPSSFSLLALGVAAFLPVVKRLRHN